MKLSAVSVFCYAANEIYKDSNFKNIFNLLSVSFVSKHEGRQCHFSQFKVRSLQVFLACTYFLFIFSVSFCRWPEIYSLQSTIMGTQVEQTDLKDYDPLSVSLLLAYAGLTLKNDDGILLIHFLLLI